MTNEELLKAISDCNGDPAELAAVQARHFTDIIMPLQFSLEERLSAVEERLSEVAELRAEIARLTELLETHLGIQARTTEKAIHHGARK